MSQEKRKSISSTSDKKTLKSVCDEITSAQNGGTGIVLDPEYQREYRFTIEDESLLIESLLLGIPIPVIYLSSDVSREPYVANVIDGQHRLRAIYRFINNKFALKGLEIHSELNGKTFQALEKGVQNQLLHQSNLSFENIHVQKDDSLEIEIFKRYNKGSHPLSPQELRNAIYVCEYNKWLNQTIKAFFQKDDIISKKLIKIYNISTKRFSDKSVHESICIMLCILKFGLQKDLNTSPDYAEFLLEYAYKNKEEQKELIETSEEDLRKINDFLLYIFDEKRIEYPFSKEIYGIKSVNYKLQIPILMIISAFLHAVNFKKIDMNKDTMSKIYNVIKNVLANSYLETGFKGSNTRPQLLEKTVKEMVELYNEKKEGVE